MKLQFINFGITIASFLVDLKGLKMNNLFTGGHFMINDAHKSVNTGSLKSFELAIKEFIQSPTNSKIGVLINDIGQTCSNSNTSCKIYSSEDNQIELNSLPKEYLILLNDYKIDQNKIILFSEKKMRNKAKRLFHKLRVILNKIYEDENSFYINLKNYHPIILTRKNNFDKYGTPACPLIMTMFGIQISQLNFSNCKNFYYIGSDNLHTIPSYLPIEKSQLILDELQIPICIKNIYLT